MKESFLTHASQEISEHMSRAHLHLVNSKSEPLSVPVQTACKAAFGWVTRKHPDFDQALLANWIEEIGALMEERTSLISSPRRYASTALEGRIRDWRKTAAGRLEIKGFGSDLDSFVRPSEAFSVLVDRKRLFEQFGASLNERDRAILVLLLRDKSTAEIAAFLNTSYGTAAKAMQRVKDRISVIANGKRHTHVSERDPEGFVICERNGK